MDVEDRTYQCESLYHAKLRTAPACTGEIADWQQTTTTIAAASANHCDDTDDDE